MIRGMVAKEKLLEWGVEDGWEPLCKFLDKPVPDIPFPQTNNAAGFADRIEALEKKWYYTSVRNQALCFWTLVGGAVAGWKVYSRMKR